MKTKSLLLLGILLSLSAITLTACGSTTDNKDSTSKDSGSTNTTGKYQKISIEEAYAKINTENPPVIVDVRTEEEFLEKHIEGALLIPNESIDKEPPALLLDKDAEILIYCRSGNRSQQAAEKLLAMGYTNVIDFGGINDWTYETVSGWNNEKPIPEGEEEPSMANFTSKDVDGNDVDESIFAEHKLTLVNIWATFCSPCLKEMPDLALIQDEYKDKGVQIVGIVADANNGNVTVPETQITLIKEIIEKTNANYPHILPSEDLIRAKLKNVQVVPETIFVDSKGNIVGDSYKGAKSKEDWENIIEETLKLVE